MSTSQALNGSGAVLKTAWPRDVDNEELESELYCETEEMSRLVVQPMVNIDSRSDRQAKTFAIWSR